MTIKARCFLTGVFFFICYQLCGQQLIRGIVVDSASFEALPYVNIQVKNTLRGTSTDVKGNFSIAANETDTLVLSSVGYKTTELSLMGYEPGLIRLTERSTYLRPIIVRDSLLFENPYEGLFDEQNAKLIKRIPFYYHKSRKDKVKAANWRQETVRVQTYVDVIINDAETKKGLMTRFALSENEYYEILGEFNEKNYSVMYYLTRAELVSFLNRFFEVAAARRK